MLDGTIVVSTLIGTGIGGAIAGAVAAVMNFPQKRRLDRLENDRIVRIENDIDAMRSGGCTVGVMVKTRLETIVAQNNRIILELGKLNRETGEQGEANSRLTATVTRAHERIDEMVEKQR